MAASGDAETIRLADELGGAAASITRTATALVIPVLGLLAWLAFLRPSGAPSAFFYSPREP